MRRDTSDAVREDSWTENRQEILQLGVQVLARRPGGSVNQLLPPWSLRLGRDTLSGEHLVGTPAGVETLGSAPSPGSSTMGARSVESNALHVNSTPDRAHLTRATRNLSRVDVAQDV